MGDKVIKFLDLEKINNRFRNEMDARIKEVLDSGWYLLGEQDKQFEKNFVCCSSFRKFVYLILLRKRAK